VCLIGGLRAQQSEGKKRIRNDRLIGVLETPVNPTTIRELEELGPGEIKDIEEFFTSYNRAQGRTFQIDGRLRARAAEAALKRAIRAFEKRSQH
jgi:inorganic pyrophosphatase